MNSSILYNIGCSGDIRGELVGGIVGDTGWGLIKECFNASNVYGLGSDNGGITNSAYEFGAIKIIDSYNIGTIKGNTGSWGGTGGIIGTMDSPITCTNVYNVGRIEDDAEYVGNIIGWMDSYRDIILENCYHLENGLETVGNKEELSIEEFIKSVEEMKTQSTYSEFDFENTWEIVDNKFPTLKRSNHIFLSQIETENIVVAKNEEKELELSFTPEIVDDAVFSYSIEDEEIAIINDDGNIVGLEEGQTKITVSNVYEDISKTINITVEESKVLESITVTTQPNKTNYSRGENFVPAGMVVTATYDDGTTEPTTDYTVVGGTNLTCLIDKVEIQSTENPEIKTEVQIQVAHDMSDATCTEAAKCKVDGCTYTESSLGHNYEATVTSPTCLEQGYTTHKCQRCNDEYVDTYTDALGHSFTNYISDNNATCTEDGTKTAKCDRCNVTDTKIDQGSKIPHNYQNGQCTKCGEKEPKLEITSQKYKIEDSYISKVEPITTIKDFKTKLTTNATQIKVYSKDGKVQEDTKTIATGMQIELKFENETKIFTIVVSGDVNGDGKADFKDLVSINKHRLRKKALEGAYLMAGDVTSDSKADFKDMVKINKYRLHKVTEL